MIFQAQVGALLRLRHPLELRGFFQTFQVKLRNPVENLERFLGLVLDLFFGELFVVELDDFLDRARALAQVFADGQQFLQDDRGARDRLEHQQLAALDALGDGDFAFARQQRNGAHFAQVHANRVVRLFEHSRRQVEFAGILGYGKFVLGFDFGGFGDGGIGGGAGGFGGGEVFVNIDAVALKRGEQVVDFFGGVHFGGQGIVYFVVEQVPALLAHGNELPYLIVFLFNGQRQESPPQNSQKQPLLRRRSNYPIRKDKPAILTAGKIEFRRGVPTRAFRCH